MSGHQPVQAVLTVESESALWDRRTVPDERIETNRVAGAEPVTTSREVGPGHGLAENVQAVVSGELSQLVR